MTYNVEEYSGTKPKWSHTCGIQSEGAQRGTTAYTKQPNKSSTTRRVQ